VLTIKVFHLHLRTFTTYIQLPSSQILEILHRLHITLCSRKKKIVFPKDILSYIISVTKIIWC